MADEFVQIPECTEDPQSMLRTIQAMKVAVEMLMGVRGDLRPSITWVQQQPPTAKGIGDRWCKPSRSATDPSAEFYWDGKAWVPEV